MSNPPQKTDKLVSWLLQSPIPLLFPVEQERRWPRYSLVATGMRQEGYKIDVPVRAVIHKPDRTLIRDGRGTEMSEGGMR